MKPDTVFTNGTSDNIRIDGEYRTIKVYGQTYYYYIPNFEYIDSMKNKYLNTPKPSDVLQGEKVQTTQELKKELRRIRCSED
jgi:hypothetical protein